MYEMYMTDIWDTYARMYVMHAKYNQVYNMVRSQTLKSLKQNIKSKKEMASDNSTCPSLDWL